MTSLIEHEMTSCLSEMERLQAKMMELQKEKEMNDAKQGEKTIHVEPNMTVMENWLDSVVGERKNAILAKKLYESLTKDTPQKKREHVLKLWRVYYNNSKDKWMPPEQGHLFHIQKHKAPDSPSQFMIDFIEATHNLFQIQQKRIDELENVVAEINAKIE